MTAIPKHEATTRPRKGQKKQPSKASYPTDYERECAITGHEPSEVGQIGWALADLARHVRDYTPGDPMAGLEVELNRLAGAAQGYAYNATIGENSLNIFTAKNSYPLRLSLEGDAVDTIAAALRRIADAMTVREVK
jgi:hypothetical protein